MKIFKVGDRVKRIAGWSHGNMMVGDVAAIESITFINDITMGTLRMKGDPELYHAGYYELADEHNVLELLKKIDENDTNN